MAARVVVVVNPTSGRGRGARLVPRVREQLSALGVEHEIVLSTGPEDPPRMARQAAEDGAEIVAALGGDGMAGMVGGPLVGMPTALAVIPAGTGNDFAGFLGFRRKSPLSVLAFLANPVIRDIDAVRIQGADGQTEARYINVAGAGFDSEVNETANRMRSRVQGTAKYVAAVFTTIRRFAPATFEVTVDGEHHSLSAMMVAVGNGRSYGGGMKICPDASLTDGLLEVCVVGAMGRAEFVRNFPRVFRGAHVGHPKVTMLRGARVEIAADRHFDVYADGERSLPLPATFEVLPKSLRVVVPEGAPA
jgi:diacylglycerol kinase (ATP)